MAAPNRVTPAGLLDGARAIAVLVPGITLYGLVFGVLAGQLGLNALEAAFFSGWVYAGSVQMALLQGWTTPLSIVFLCLTTLAMNSRYVLMGAALRPHLAGAPPGQVAFSLFFLADSNWTMAMRRPDAERPGVAFFVGSGIAMWIVWVGATLAGHAFGQVITRPRDFALDFLLGAFFAGSAVHLWSRSRRLMPFLVGAAVAVLVARLWPGPWYILAGALAGSLVGAFQRVDPT